MDISTHGIAVIVWNIPVSSPGGLTFFNGWIALNMLRFVIHVAPKWQFNHHGCH